MIRVKARVKGGVMFSGDLCVLFSRSVESHAWPRCEVLHSWFLAFALLG
jgi:hypothetical protein